MILFVGTLAVALYLWIGILLVLRFAIDGMPVRLMPRVVIAWLPALCLPRVRDWLNKDEQP
jgi:hypothetical protein